MLLWSLATATTSAGGLDCTPFSSTSADNSENAPQHLTAQCCPATALSPTLKRDVRCHQEILLPQAPRLHSVRGRETAQPHTCGADARASQEVMIWLDLTSFDIALSRKREQSDSSPFPKTCYSCWVFNTFVDSNRITVEGFLLVKNLHLTWKIIQFGWNVGYVTKISKKSSPILVLLTELISSAKPVACYAFHGK